MKLKTLTQLERSVGGRPKVNNPKIRVSVYLTQSETDQLKILAVQEARPVSQIIRHILINHLKPNLDQTN